MAAPAAKKVQALLGLALRSRSAALGRSACRRAARRSELRLLVLARDAGASVESDCGAPDGVPRIRLELDKQELGLLVRRSALAVLGITDPDLAAGILKYARRETP